MYKQEVMIISAGLHSFAFVDYNKSAGYLSAGYQAKQHPSVAAIPEVRNLPGMEKNNR